MLYSPLTEEQIQDILKETGYDNVTELFSDFPCNKEIDFSLPPPLSELSLKRTLKSIAQKNKGQSDYISFLGGGSYDHFIPSVVRHITSRSEFYTAYTPYQPEISQGTLRAIFEFQSMICELTGMDIANASLYDGASALAEACVVAVSDTGRKRVLVPNNIPFSYIDVLHTCLLPRDIEVEIFKSEVFYHFDIKMFNQRLNEEVAAVILPCPDFFGNIINYSEVLAEAKKKGVATIFLYNPIVLSLLKSPGELGADIAVAEGQPLGISSSFGGPGLGLISAKQKYLRLMPGRIAGQTNDKKGNTGYVLTFQTREQHIKREKSLSNICSNQGLMALAATVYMSAMGSSGLRRVAEMCYKKTEYLKREIKKIKGYKILNHHPTFNEFLLLVPLASKEMLVRLKKKNILAGIDMSCFNKGINNIILVTVTEKKTQCELDYLVKSLREVISG
ncbi:MAG: aminomethyl-transferring glycine dehydrogenase subunit GcvPA [bacterium]|nr:aminomethyl-transferring glycine dehydrogenase subunit GcvPA [bacterium]